MWKGRDAVIGNAADTTRPECVRGATSTRRVPREALRGVAPRWRGGGGRSCRAGCPGTSQRHVRRPARSTRSAWTTRWSPEVGPADTTPVAMVAPVPGFARQVASGIDRECGRGQRGEGGCGASHGQCGEQCCDDPRGNRDDAIVEVSASPGGVAGISCGHTERQQTSCRDGRTQAQPVAGLGSPTIGVQLDRRLPPLASTRAIGSATAA